jgi:hypothetical protein
MKRTLIALVISTLLGVSVLYSGAGATPSTVVNLNILSANQQRGLAYARGLANAPAVAFNAGLSAQPSPTPTPMTVLTVQQYADKLVTDACDSFDAQRIAALGAADVNLQAFGKAYVDATPAQQAAARAALGLP